MTPSVSVALGFVLRLDEAGFAPQAAAYSTLIMLVVGGLPLAMRALVALLARRRNRLGSIRYVARRAVENPRPLLVFLLQQVSTDRIVGVLGCRGRPPRRDLLAGTGGEANCAACMAARCRCTASR